MSDQTRQQLQQAYDLIKAGKREQAGAILIDILKRDRNNADAWWLLANASNDSDKARQALENVLRIRPDDVRARQKLDALVGSSPTPPPSEHFSMPISPTTPVGIDDPFGSSGSSDDPFGSFPTPSWNTAPASNPVEFPAVSPFGDFDLDNLDVSADIPFDDDPFQVPPVGTSDTVISRPGARTVSTPPPMSAPSDPFGNVTYGGDPFADVGGLRKSKPSSGTSSDPFAPPKKRSGANPVIVVLILALVACGACTAVVLLNGGRAAQLVQQVMLTVTSDPNFGDFATVMASSGTLSASNTGNGQTLPSGLTSRGSLSYGQALSNTVAGTKDDSWTFRGTAGDTVTIEADANGSSLDPQLALYDTKRKQIAQNDDIDFGTDKNARITITLPQTGTYTIVVSAFGSGGAYTLHLSRQS